MSALTTRIVIEVERGCVTAVTADTECTVTLVDYDGLSDGAVEHARAWGPTDVVPDGIGSDAVHGEVDELGSSAKLLHRGLRLDPREVRLPSVKLGEQVPQLLQHLTDDAHVHVGRTGLSSASAGRPDKRSDYLLRAPGRKEGRLAQLVGADASSRGGLDQVLDERLVRAGGEFAPL